MSELVTGIRVHRLVLQQDIRQQTEHLRELVELEMVCQEKLRNNERRTYLLENELTRIPNAHPKYAPFTCLLSLPDGWQLVRGFLRNEVKRKQSALSEEQLQRCWGKLASSKLNVITYIYL